MNSNFIVGNDFVSKNAQHYMILALPGGIMWKLQWLDGNDLSILLFLASIRRSCALLQVTLLKKFSFISYFNIYIQS